MATGRCYFGGEDKTELVIGVDQPENGTYPLIHPKPVEKYLHTEGIMIH